MGKPFKRRRRRTASVFAVVLGLLFIIATAPFGLTQMSDDAGPFAPNTLGVNIHFTTPLAGEMEMLAQAGFRWVRMDFDWASTEPEPGTYDFSAYDRLLANLDAYGIHALLILDYANPLYDQGYSPYDEEGRVAFANWAAAAAVHFGGRGIVWEMYNEPDLTWTQPKGAEGSSAENYAKLALAVGKSLRGAAPKETYVGPALSYLFDLPFLETSLKAGLLEYWSGVTVHPYRQCPPETIANGACDNGSAPRTTYAQVKAVVAKYLPRGKTVPILSGEWGYSTYWGCCDEETTAKFLPREWLTNLGNQIPLSIWYDWRDDACPPAPNACDPEELHFGVVLRPYHAGRQPVFDAKPAYYSAKTINTALRDYRFERRVDVGNAEDYVLMFTKPDGEFVLASWTTGSTHDAVIPAKAGQEFNDESYLGEELSLITAGQSGLMIRLTDGPQYLTPR
jgi:polysaccharide biosynthesis protein PslG